MTEQIIIAIIAAAGGMIGSLIGSNNKMIVFRIDQLDKKVEKHNSIIERTYHLEERTEIQEERIRTYLF